MLLTPDWFSVVLFGKPVFLVQGFVAWVPSDSGRHIFAFFFPSSVYPQSINSYLRQMINAGYVANLP